MSSSAILVVVIGIALPDTPFARPLDAEERRGYCLPLGRVSGACVNADAATLFTALGVLGFLSSLLAFVATLGDVRSLFAIRA